MADDRDPTDPPRKFYGLASREFERVNPPRPADAPTSDTAGAAASAPSSGGVPPDPAKPIDVRELCAQAATPGPVLNAGGAPVAANDIHGILRENVARENAAGVNDVPYQRRRLSRRFRDYVIVMLALNGALAARAAVEWHHLNPVGFVACVAGIGLCSAAVTWVMWFVMDKY